MTDLDKMKQAAREAMKVIEEERRKKKAQNKLTATLKK